MPLLLKYIICVLINYICASLVIGYYLAYLDNYSDRGKKEEFYIFMENLMSPLRKAMEYSRIFRIFVIIAGIVSLILFMRMYDVEIALSGYMGVCLIFMFILQFLRSIFKKLL